MNYFKGCTALITGASSGIGREIACQLAPHAQTLILVARNRKVLETLKFDFDRIYPELRVGVYELDLRDGAGIDALVEWLVENNLTVNFLVNNAGHGDYGDFESADWVKLESMISLNITALTRLTHRLIPMLKSHISKSLKNAPEDGFPAGPSLLNSFESSAPLTAPFSAILNVSSVAGFLPLPHLAVYAATKAYVSSLSEALRIELHDSRVSVTTLCPGPIHTGFGSVARRTAGDQSGTPEDLRMPLREAVREALEAVARNRARIIPGWKVAAGIALVSLLPMVLLRFALSQWRKTITNNSFCD